MNKNEQEIEVKFYLNDIKGFEKRLIAQGATLVHPRIHEANLRFDTPDGDLSRDFRVLRLRRDSRIYLTYKDLADPKQTVSVRREIEFEVSDFDAARSFLEALGFTATIFYEKYRTTYTLADSLVTLDEMPFGSFTEIESKDPGSIRKLAEILSLKWETRCTDSYMMLFDRLKQNTGISASNLSFDELGRYSISAEDLGLSPADIP